MKIMIFCNEHGNLEVLRTPYLKYTPRNSNNGAFLAALAVNTFYIVWIGRFEVGIWKLFPDQRNRPGYSWRGFGPGCSIRRLLHILTSIGPCRWGRRGQCQGLEGEQRGWRERQLWPGLLRITCQLAQVAIPGKHRSDHRFAKFYKMSLLRTTSKYKTGPEMVQGQALVAVFDVLEAPDQTLPNHHFRLISKSAESKIEKGSFTLKHAATSAKHFRQAFWHFCIGLLCHGSDSRTYLTHSF